MCTANVDDLKFENLELSEKPSFSGNTICRSCTEKGCIVLRKKDVYCKNCFLCMETHKFRAALGKSKMMKSQDRVLVAYSGSQSSAALLHLLHTGVTEEQHKKLMFSIVLLYIDEGSLFNTSVEEREKLSALIKDSLSSYSFPLFMCNLSESLNDSLALESSLKFCEKYDKELIDLFQNVKSVSSKEDLLHVLRQKLILKAAEKLNCSKVFTAEVGTDLAIKLLERFSLGRGDQASFEAGFCDSRIPHIKILRPLRDFTKKEIAFYNRFQSIESLCGFSLTAKLPNNVSIKKLTEKFVSDLQEGFPSTVYTIFRTAEKLNADPANKNIIDHLCVLCEDKIRTHKTRNDYTAAQAANFSRNVSREKTNNCAIETNENCCESCLGRNRTDIYSQQLENFFCYGCMSIVRDMKNLNSLLKSLIQSEILKRNSEVMREQISDFLLGDPSES